MSLAWYWYAGWIALVLIVGYYLATRKKYRDPTAAPNYEKVRNKLSTRKLKVEEKVEDYTGVSLGLFGDVHSIIMGIVTVGIVIVVGCTIMSQIGNTLSDTSMAANVSGQMSDSLQQFSSFIPILDVVLIATTVLAVLFAAFSRSGIGTI